MIYVGTEIINKNLQGEERRRAVEVITRPSGRNPYFKDENPEETGVPDFSRRLREEQDRLMNEERQLRNLRQSNDLKELYKQFHWVKPKFIDVQR